MFFKENRLSLITIESEKQVSILLKSSITQK